MSFKKVFGKNGQNVSNLFSYSFLCYLGLRTVALVFSQAFLVLLLLAGFAWGNVIDVLHSYKELDSDCILYHTHNVQAQGSNESRAK